MLRSFWQSLPPYNKLFIGLLALALAVLVWYAWSLRAPRSLDILKTARQPVEATVFALDPVRGNTDAPVTIIEFADFACIQCKNTEPQLREALALFPDTVKLVWKDLPLTALPAPSIEAHIAAHCAARQDLFWEYHDLLYAEQDTWKTQKNFSELAGRITGIDMEEFDTCLTDENEKIMEHLKKNSLLAGDLHVDAVPFFIINNKRRIAGPLTPSLLRRELNALNIR